MIYRLAMEVWHLGCFTIKVWFAPKDFLCKALIPFGDKIAECHGAPNLSKKNTKRGNTNTVNFECDLLGLLKPLILVNVWPFWY
jgi:hypothetical protein